MDCTVIITIDSLATANMCDVVWRTTKERVYKIWPCFCFVLFCFKRHSVRFTIEIMHLNDKKVKLKINSKHYNDYYAWLNVFQYRHFIFQQTTTLKETDTDSSHILLSLELEIKRNLSYSSKIWPLLYDIEFPLPSAGTLLTSYW